MHNTYLYILHVIFNILVLFLPSVDCCNDNQYRVWNGDDSCAGWHHDANLSGRLAGAVVALLLCRLRAANPNRAAASARSELPII
jgi:hypothetical protein